MILGLEPEVDEKRNRRVTIRQCLQHIGGWDRSDSFDPMFQSIRIARVLGTKAPAGPGEVIRFMQKWPLDFDPGTRYAYSNYGYCLLGRVVEKISGHSYERYVQKHVLKPMGVTRMRVGRTRIADRAKGEVRYHVDGEKVGLSVFDEDLGKKVSRAVFDRSFDERHPRRQPVPVGEVSRTVFSRRHLDQLTGDLARKFHAHLPGAGI